jgi:hypothetical protein
VAVIFFDETGLNTLPPGIRVTVYPAGARQTPPNVAFRGYTQMGGVLNAPLQGAVAYSAVFYGSIAPTQQVSFAANALPGTNTVVAVPGYRAPFLSAGGYSAELQHRYPRGWATTPGTPPVLPSFMAALAALLAYIDNSEQQQILADLRLQTSQGAALDSWAYDFFGEYLLRYTNEADSIYYQRILAAFGEHTTLAAIQNIVNLFYQATAAQTLLELNPSFAWDTLGIFDFRGGFDILGAQGNIVIPSVLVWDGQSSPSLASQWNIISRQFVIQIGFNENVAAWFLDQAHLDFETVLIDYGTGILSTSPPDVRLGALVDLFKATGTQPLYLTSST